MILKPYTIEETVIEKALHAHECVRWIEAFIANLGDPLWGSQSMQELASRMRNVLPFLIRDAKSCIDCESHKGCCKDLQWMYVFISHTHLHVVLSLWRSLISYKVWKSQKSETNFWKECIKPKNERHLCLQSYTHTIVHSSALYYQNFYYHSWFSKKLLKMKNSNNNKINT